MPTNGNLARVSNVNRCVVHRAQQLAIPVKLNLARCTDAHNMMPFPIQSPSRRRFCYKPGSCGIPDGEANVTFLRPPQPPERGFRRVAILAKDIVVPCPIVSRFKPTGCRKLLQVKAIIVRAVNVPVQGLKIDRLAQLSFD